MNKWNWTTLKWNSSGLPSVICGGLCIFCISFAPTNRLPDNILFTSSVSGHHLLLAHQCLAIIMYILLPPAASRSFLLSRNASLCFERFWRAPRGWQRVVSESRFRESASQTRSFTSNYLRKKSKMAVIRLYKSWRWGKQTAALSPLSRSELSGRRGRDNDQSRSWFQRWDATRRV